MNIENNTLLSVGNADIIDGTFTIPDSVTSIGNDAFWSCSSLTEINIPNSVTSIGNYAFYNCSALTKINDLRVKYIDGDPFVIQNEKQKDGITILKGYKYKLNPKKDDIQYVAAKGEFFAHGITSKKAIIDLNFKIYVSELKHNKLKSTDKVDVKLYRAITGACEIGVKEWIQQTGVNEGISVKELLEVFKQNPGYGMEKFKELVEIE